MDVLKETIDALNVFRDVYLNGGVLYYENGNMRCFDKKDKEVWWQRIQLLPSSYNQTRNVMLNYEVLANIYKSRKNHKLDEWRELCSWIESLPYSKLIVGSESKRYAKIGKSFSDGFQKGLGIDVESVEEAAKNYDPNDGVENHITLIKED